MILSILIPTTNDRYGVTTDLLDNLMNQVGDVWNLCILYLDNPDRQLYIYQSPEVEILVLWDDKKMTTGKKRNELYANASGKYSVSVDSDDWVPYYYVCELLEAAKSDADCFNINGTYTTNGRNERKWFIHKDNKYTTEYNILGEEIFLRYPNHITAIKSEICKKFFFPEITFGEDYHWATQIHDAEAIKTSHTIEKPLYHYRYNNKK